MRVPKLTAEILRGMFFIARCIGLVSFRFKNSGNKVMVLEESRWSRSWWKWFTIVLRIVPVCAHVLALFLWVLKTKKVGNLMLSIHLVLVILSYLSMIILQIFHGPEVVKLVNRYIELFHRVRSLSFRKDIGLGGGREFVLVLFFIGFHFIELLVLFQSFPGVPSLQYFVSFSCLLYTASACKIMMQISFGWYLSLGVLYAEVQQLLHLELQTPMIFRVKPISETLRRLETTMILIREISYVIKSMQNFTNVHLFLSLATELLLIVPISNHTIIESKSINFWQWLALVRIILDVLIICFVIQESVNQFRCIQDLTMELFLAADLKDWNQTVEVFVTHLNLNQLRVRPLHLFDVSNELFLSIFAGVVNYMVLIIQIVMQQRME